MSVLPKSETDKAIARTEAAEESVRNALYKNFWSMDTDTLTGVLQRMLNEDVLAATFARHYVTATALNAAAEAAGLPHRLATVAGRAFTVGEDGLVILSTPTVAQPQTDESFSLEV